MQKISVKDFEIVKVNGDSYYKWSNGDLLPVTAATRNKIAVDLIERACTIDMNLGNGTKGVLDKNRTVFVYETNKVYPIKYFRTINNPANFGLPIRRNCNYLLYWNFDDEDEKVHIFEFENDKLVNVIKDYKEKLLDGEYI